MSETTYWIVTFISIGLMMMYLIYKLKVADKEDKKDENK